MTPQELMAQFTVFKRAEVLRDPQSWDYELVHDFCWEGDDGP